MIHIGSDELASKNYGSRNSEEAKQTIPPAELATRISQWLNTPDTSGETPIQKLLTEASDAAVSSWEIDQKLEADQRQREQADACFVEPMQ